MRDDFDALIAERFAVLVDLPVPDTWSRVQSKLDPTATPFTSEESTMIDLEAPMLAGEHRNGRPFIGALIGIAAAATLIGALVIVDGRGDPDQSPPVDSAPGTLPATTIYTAPATEFVDVPEEQIEVVREFVKAVNAGDADAFLGVVDPEGGFDLQGGFAENTDLMFGHLFQHFDEEPLVRAWISIVDAWGLEVQLTSCRPSVAADDNGFLMKVVEGDDGFLLCEVRTLWHTLSLELGEEWQINLRGNKVTWFGQWAAPRLRDLNPQPRQLPFGYDDLEAWEAWLEQTDPGAAARYLIPRAAPQPCDAEGGCVELNLAPDDPELAHRIWNLSQPAENGWMVDGHRFLPINAIPYDPQWADEIQASIQKYLDEQSIPDS